MQRRGLDFILCNLLFIFLFFSGVFVYLIPLLFFYISKRFSLQKGIFFALILLFELIFLFLGMKYLQLPSELFQRIFNTLAWVPGFSYYSIFGFKGVVLGMSFYWLTLSSLGLSFAYQSQKNQTWFFLILKVAGFTFLSLMLIAFILSKGNFAQITFALKSYLGHNFDAFLQIPKQFERDELSYLKVNRENILDVMVLLTPGFLLCSLMTVVAVNESLSRVVFRSFNTGMTQAFELMFLPFGWVWLFIVNLAFYLANANLILNFRLEALLMNFLLFFGFAFFFQGLAVLQFYLRRYGLETWLLTLIYLSLFLVFPPLMFLLFGVGILDAWVGFRKLNKVLPKI